MIIACIIAFNEERMLPGCLESLQGQVDRSVVVDGAFEHYEHEEPVSTDATREIAWCYGAEWIDCPDDEEGYPRAWHTQVEKRGTYFVGNEGDWYLVIDADERLYGRLPEPEYGYHYAFRVHSWQGTQTWTPRLFQHRGWMRYEGSHNAVWSGDRLINLPGAVMWPPEWGYLMHLTDARTPEQQQRKQDYYRWRLPYERAYRDGYGI